MVKDAKFRENLQALQAFIWHQEAQVSRHPDIGSTSTFFAEFENSMFTPAETIRRNWQKIQEENAHLRGTNYDKRHNHQEVVKEDLGYKVHNDV